jgi:hypothetical protein
MSSLKNPTRIFYKLSIITRLSFKRINLLKKYGKEKNTNY